MITSSKLTIGSRGSASTIAAADGNHSSASTIAADKVSGSHVLTISDYFKTMGLGVGKYITSAAFLVGGHTWSIRYYPDGYNSSSEDYISFFLEPIDYVGNMFAHFRFCLLGQFHVPVPIPSFWAGMHSNTFSSTAHEQRGCPCFVRRKELQNSPHLEDNTFRIRCESAVTMVKVHAVVPFLASPSQDLHRHLGDLLESKVGADMTFIVGGKLFTAHRIVLAVRSPVFVAQFFGPMKENEAGAEPGIKYRGLCVRLELVNHTKF